MWKDYSFQSIKKNRASSISIMAAAFISTLFLSLLCCLAYNFWIYDVEKIVLEEGSWQARITGLPDKADLSTIQNFANVEQAVVNDDLSTETKITVDITFQNARTVFRDVPLMTEKLGLPEAAAQYNRYLLSRYMIHDPADPEPPLLMAFFLMVLLVVSGALILIIHNSFAVSMNARIHQFGIFSSIGAAPGQIRTCLMQEAFILCGIPVLAGNAMGILLSYITIAVINVLASDVSGRHEAVFRYHPLVFIMAILIAAMTVLVSAWIPARRLSKMTPLEAIRNTGELQLKKQKNSRILRLLFGIEGELAGNALRAQKKALRTSTLSLTLSFFGFSIMLCFFTLSEISTNHTYFERYQNAWDVMMTVKDAEIRDFTLTDEIHELSGMESCIIYQKALSKTIIPAQWQSRELMELGGVTAVAGNSVTAVGNGFEVKAPLVILDDASFLHYCEQAGIAPGLDGSIVFNRIWDSVNSNFRYKKYIPFLDETQKRIPLLNGAEDGSVTEVDILGFARNPPVLREEYGNYTLVQFLPRSLWSRISEQVGNGQPDMFIRLIAGGNATLEGLDDLESGLTQIVAPHYNVVSENRIQERLSDKIMRKGAAGILGAFCVLLAVIGIANVFSNTMGFLRQRRREFAQYMSVGMTTESMKKLFCIEALVIAGRPIVVTVPLTVAAMAFLIRASHLEPVEFLTEAPMIPIVLFMLSVFGFVGLAYFIGGRRMLRCSLADALRNENMI